METGIADRIAQLLRARQERLPHVQAEVAAGAKSTRTSWNSPQRWRHYAAIRRYRRTTP